MSVLPPKADMARLGRDVRFVPIAEIGLGLHDGTEEQRRSNKTDLYLVRGDDENSNSSGGCGHDSRWPCGAGTPKREHWLRSPSVRPIARARHSPRRDPQNTVFHVQPF